MEKLKLRIGILVALMPGIISCERVTLPQENLEAEDETVLVWDTDSTGDGTASAPASVVDLKARENEFLGRSCWVAGYIVGYVVRTLKNAAFTSDDAVQSNILLAVASDTKDVEFCVPIELKTEKWKKALSLAHNPENLGRKVAVHGLINTYFGVTGVRSVDDAVWLENDENTSDLEPEVTDSVSDNISDEPQGQPSEKPDETFDEEPDVSTEMPNDGKQFYVNKVLLQQVKSQAAVQIGARYMIGTLPDQQTMQFIATSMQYGTGQNYRRAIEAQGDVDVLNTEQGIAPAVFVLEQAGEEYRFRDELSGAYLAYDVRGDISSTSWLPLYTLPEENLSQRYCAGFQIGDEEDLGQISTAESVKYSEADSRFCRLRYNSGGKNFKLNYQKNGVAVCLYLVK